MDANDFEALEAMLDEKHSFTNPMTAEPGDKLSHLAMIESMTSAFEGKHILDVVMSEGDWVSGKGHWTGRHTGEFNGIAATGTYVIFTWMDMMHVVDGKLLEEYFEMNPMAIMQQIGASQATAL